MRHRRRQSVLVPVNPNVYSNQRSGSEVLFLPKSSLEKAKPTVTARYSSDLLKVVEGGSSAFYSVHFEFTTPPTHPIIVSPMTSAHTLRIYPSVIKFNPDNAHLPQFFRVSVLHETDDDTMAPMTLEHSVQSIDASFCGQVVQHMPRTLTVKIFHGGGKYLMSTGDATYGSLGQDTFDSRDEFGEVSFRHLYLNGRKASMAAGSGFRRSTSARSTSLCESVHVTMLSDIACGSHHAIVIDANGRLFAFGDSSRGQLGLGSLRPVPRPEVWNGIDVDGRLHSKLMDVACGAAHTVVITDDGEVLTWGDNDSGQLGVSSRQVPSLALPKCLPWPLGHKVTHMACGLKHTVAVLDTGAVVSWGYGKSGALGHGTRDNVDSPKEVESLRGKSVFQVACGDMHSAIVLNSGELITAGWSENGRLGRVKSLDVCGCTFERVDLKERLCSWVACGGAHTMCLTDKYEVWAFGANAFGQLGVGDCRDRAYPVQVVFFRKVKVHHIVLGKFHSMAISDDRLLYAWGNGEQGQCGLGAFPHIYTLPHLVTSILGCPVFQIAAGDAFTLILTSNTPASVKELAGRDEHWRLRQEQLIANDQVHRDSVRKYLQDKSQEKFHSTMHVNNPFLSVLQTLHQSSNFALANGAMKLRAPPSPDTIAAAVKQSGLCRQRSMEKLQFVVDPATLAQVHEKVHSPRPGTAASFDPRPSTRATTNDPIRAAKTILAQSPSLQRALKSAASLQRPRSGLAVCVGSPRCPQQTIQVVAPSTSSSQPESFVKPAMPAATSPTAKPQWLLRRKQEKARRTAPVRPRTPPPAYTDDQTNQPRPLGEGHRPQTPPPDYDASVVALLGLQDILPTPRA